MCDENSEKFKNLFDMAKISYNDYIRTTEERHKNVVQNYWNDLNRQNLINSGKYEGYYSVSDESFIPLKDLIHEKETNNYKTILNQPVEYITETSYLLNFKNYIDKYLSKLNNNELTFIPTYIKNEVNEYINSELHVLSISRPKSRVSWGIEVPNDKSQVIYVWFEALINYLTVLKSYLKTNNMSNNDNEVEYFHIIGKDISKFHCYIWPLILLMNNNNSKINIIMHSHWLMNSVRINFKSKG